MIRLTQIALMASISSLALAATPALAQQSPAESTAADEGSAIIVTGTRRTDRTVADSPVPVDVISNDAIATSGQAETNKILNSLVPSFNFPQPSIADGTDALRPATLRGLSPDQTLVLINGKRRHISALLNINGTVGRGSAAVDLNLIPGLAIDRIEVLRDGASSQYGSDAIAGVINIQLKKQRNGGRASISYGKYVTTLDGVANVTGLQTDASGQPVLDPTDNRVFLANTSGQRKARDGELITYSANIGLPIGAEGYFNVTGEYRDRSRTNRAGFDIRPNYVRPASGFDARELTFNRLETIYGDAKTQDFDFFVNSEVPVGDFQLYAFGSFGQRDGSSAANYRQQSSAANRDNSAISPNTTPTAANFVPLTPDGFLPLIATDLTDYSGTFGIRGEVGGWKADLSIGYGHNAFDYQVQNTLNTSYGTGSQRTFDAGGLKYAQTVSNLDLTHDFDIGLAKPLSVAFGGEYRRETFKIRPGDIQSFTAGPFALTPFTTTAANCAAQQGVFNAGTSLCAFPGRQAPVGSQGFPGIPARSATNRTRDSYAAYVELDTDPFEGFTTTLAGRYEHFSDFGDTYNGKFAARYEPVAGYALRGSISNGFRAPSLQQQFFTTTSTNFISGVPVDISTVAVDSPVARALGARDLRPERSLNYSFGGTANPIRGLNLTVDYYNIRIRNRIVLTENLGTGGSATAAVRAILDANGFQSVGAARFFINGLNTRTQGVDAVATYRVPFEAIGQLTLTGAYNYNKTRILSRINALSTLPGVLLFGRVEGIRFTDGQPRDKIVLSAEDKLGDFGFTARTTRYGRVISPNTAAPISDPTSLTALGPDDIRLGAKWIADLELRYTFLKRFDLAVGADNLFDVYPDRSPTGARPASQGGGVYPVNQYFQPYSGFSPFGFNGRFLYGRVGVKF